MEYELSGLDLPREDRANQLKLCEWCGRPLPAKRYHLRICPRCRKISVEWFTRSYRTLT